MARLLKDSSPWVAESEQRATAGGHEGTSQQHASRLLDRGQIDGFRAREWIRQSLEGDGGCQQRILWV